MASTLKPHFSRSHDLIARYGGEEFICLIPERDLAAGRRKAEELCRAVVAQEIDQADSPTAGAGVRSAPV